MMEESKLQQNKAPLFKLTILTYLYLSLLSENFLESVDYTSKYPSNPAYLSPFYRNPLDSIQDAEIEKYVNRNAVELMMVDKLLEKVKLENTPYTVQEDLRPQNEHIFRSFNKPYEANSYNQQQFNQQYNPNQLSNQRFINASNPNFQTCKNLRIFFKNKHNKRNFLKLKFHENL